MIDGVGAQLQRVLRKFGGQARVALVEHVFNQRGGIPCTIDHGVRVAVVDIVVSTPRL